MTFRVRVTDIATGEKQQKIPITTSTGIADAGKLISTNEQGVVDSTLLDAVTPQFQKETFTIDAGNTKASLLLPGADFAKYFLMAEGDNSMYSLEMNVFESNGDSFDSISNKIGVKAIAINSSIIGGLHIDITNNEAYTITVTLTYMSN